MNKLLDTKAKWMAKNMSIEEIDHLMALCNIYLVILGVSAVIIAIMLGYLIFELLTFIN